LFEVGLGRLLSLQQFLFVAALDNFSEYEHGDHKIKGGLAHCVDFVAKK
jgi:hypothetical protein